MWTTGGFDGRRILVLKLVLVLVWRRTVAGGDSLWCSADSGSEADAGVGLAEDCCWRRQFLMFVEF